MGGHLLGRGITEAATHIKDAIDQYGNYAFFASVGGGGSYSFMEAMTLPMAFGSPTVFEPGCAQCYLPRWSMSKLFYGGDDQSVADNAVQEIFKVEDNKTEIVVIWGAQPRCPKRPSRAAAWPSCAPRREDRGRGPELLADAVKADVWLPVRPGTDTKLLLSWFRYIFENKLYDEEFTKYWTNLPFLIDPDTKLPVKAQELFPDFQQTTPENTPAYVCFDLKTNAVAPFEYSAPADSAVDPGNLLDWRLQRQDLQDRRPNLPRGGRAPGRSRRRPRSAGFRPIRSRRPSSSTWRTTAASSTAWPPT